MRATITNLSFKGRDKVVTIVFPQEKSRNYPTECTFLTDDNRKFRAVKTGSKGDRMTTFRLFTTLNPSETIKGQILPETHKDSYLKYKWHKWVADDILAICPDIGIKINNNVVWTSEFKSIKAVEHSTVHQRWHVRKFIPALGIIFEFWLDINQDDPVIDFWGKIVWSDRNDPSDTKEFQAVLLKAGEYIALDFKDLHGATTPEFIDGAWTSVLATNIRIKDGAGLPLSGTMPCFVGPNVMPGPGVDLESEQQEDNRDFNSLLAAIFGQVVGISHDWNGEWLANKYIPRRKDQTKLQNEAQQEWSKFKGLPSGRGWYADRPIGIGDNPARTGDQEDFGATKGTYAVSAVDPRFILLYRYSSYTELFRGFNHYESNALPIKESDHPSWVTWSGLTHYHTGVSPDRLNKAPGFNPFPGWYWGYDDQHRSQNYIAAYYCLSDDPLILDQIEHHTTTDLAMYRMRYPTYGAGAARAQGRLAGAWANFYTLVDGPLKNDIKRLLDSKWDAMANQPWFGEHNQIPVIGSHGPDGRKPVYDADGNLLPSWSVWEHALAVIGLYNAYKADSSHPLAKDLLTRLMETVVNNGCFEADDGWWIIGDMWYRNGEALPKPYTKDNDKILYGRGGVAGWVVSAMIAAAEFLDPGPTKDKAIACASFFTGRQEADDNRSAEWWATAASVDL